MPKPIPDWDLARRLVKFVGTRQISGKDTTQRITSRTLGVGRERMEKIFIEREIVGVFKQVSEKPSGDDLILLQYIPPNLAADAQISSVDLARSYEELINGTPKQRVAKQKKISKRKKENLRVLEVWHAKKNGEN